MKLQSTSLVAGIILATMLSPIVVSAKSGCTDPYAINYDSTATDNDGSCTYAVTHVPPAKRASFSTAITESSGLAYTDGNLWTHNDSGNPQDIFKVDTTTGATKQVVVISNYGNTDWEDLTADSNYIYIGDFGNNKGDRTNQKILKIAKADIPDTGTIVHVAAQAINFSYADQTDFSSTDVTNYDCEGFLNIGDSLYLFTKDRGDHYTRVYKLPKTPGTYSVSPYTNYNVSGLITGADYNPNTKQIALVGYMGGHGQSFMWILSDYKGDMFFSGNKRRIEIGNGTDWQTEGIAYDNDQRLFISCETTSDNPAGLYTQNEDWHMYANGVSNVKTKGSLHVYPNPATIMINVDMQWSAAQKDITMGMYDTNGKLLNTWRVPAGNTYHTSIPVSQLPVGNYVLKVKSDNSMLSERFSKTH